MFPCSLAGIGPFQLGIPASIYQIADERNKVPLVVRDTYYSLKPRIYIIKLIFIQPTWIYSLPQNSRIGL